jgi:hypothetical protein
MKTFILFLIVLFTSFNIKVMAQDNNSGVFNSPNDYKHPNPTTKKTVNNVAAEYVEPTVNSGNYKQQNNNVNPKIEGLIIKSPKKEKKYNALSNPNNYKTQH